MWRVLVTGLLLCVLSSSALAQTGTAQTKSSLNTEQDNNFADNTSNAITPLILRQTVADMIASWQQAPKINSQVATTYTVVVDDYGKLITLSNAAAIAVTVPQATTTFATFNAFFCNQGAGTATLTPTTSTVNGGATYTLLKNQCSWLVSDGTNYQAMTIPPGNLTGSIKGPTSQTFTTGTNATYTTASGATWIEITIVGGGAGGAGGGAAPTAATAGNPSCWNTSGTACTSPVYQAGGGGAMGAGTPSLGGGAGGTVSGSGTCIRATAGGGGSTASQWPSVSSPGALGGNSILAGGGQGVSGAAGAAGAANTGGGGGGGGNTGAATLYGGGGGGAGAGCYVIINNPAATYTYTVGATAAGGAAGTNGFAGGAGAAGVVSVVEHYGQ